MSYLSDFKVNDLSNFTSFYEETKKHVFYAIYLITKSIEATEDLLQETYMSLLNNANKIKEGTNLEAWLVTVAKNKAINYWNKMKTEKEYLELLKNYSYSDDQNIDTGLLSKIKENLTEKEFEVFILRVLGEYSFKEISSLTNTKIGTLTWMYQEARKKLTSVFKEK